VATSMLDVYRFLAQLRETYQAASLGEPTMALESSEPGQRAWFTINCWSCSSVTAYSYATHAAIERIENLSPLWCVACFKRSETEKGRGARSSRRRKKGKLDG